jgi:hypothetical protein
MPKNQNSLQAVLERQARGAPQVAPPPPKAVPEAGTDTAPERPKFSRPSREGKKLIAAHVDPKVARQLKLLAVEDDTTVQALLEEALNLLFVKKGRAPIAGGEGQGGR